MVKDNIYDEIITELMGELDEVIGAIGEDFKGTRPFDKVEVPDERRLDEYYNMLPQMDRMLEEFGGEVTGKYISKMKQLERRKYGQR